MREPIKESFNWMIPEWEILPLGKRSVKVKGIALPSDVVSKNKRKYLDEELMKAARTLSGKPITINHDDNIIIGNVIHAEYENGAIEYLGKVSKEPYVSMLRNHDPDIMGVSVQAGYLHCKCPRCHERFFSEADFIDHMNVAHGILDGVTEVHGIIFDALSLVISPESPGVIGATVELCEMLQHSSPLRLLETVTKNKREENEMRKKIEKANISVRNEDRTTISKLREQEDGQAPPPHPTDEGGHECPEGTHWDEVAGTCVHDIVQGQDTTPPDTKTTVEQAEDHGCEEGEHWDGEKCVANVEEQEDHGCAEDEHWDSEKEECVANTMSEQEDHECPEGEHWNGEKCVPDVSEQEDHGCAEGEHWDSEKGACVPNVAEQAGHCPPGFRWDEVEGTCVAEELPKIDPPANAPQFVPEPPIAVPKTPILTDAPAVGPKTVSEQEDGQLADAPFPVEPTTDLSVTKECPDGSHWDEVAGTCVPDLIPEVVTGEAPVEKGGVTVGEIKLPPLMKLGEPFANYTGHADCVSKNQDKDNPDAYCADIKRKTEGDKVSETFKKAFPAINEMDTRLSIRDTKIAETTNQLNVAIANISTKILGLPKREKLRAIAEASLRGKGDKAVVVWTKKALLTLRADDKKLQEALNHGLTEALKKLNLSEKNYQALITTIRTNAIATSEKNFKNLIEYIQKKDSMLATELGKEMGLAKKHSTAIKTLKVRVLKDSGLNKRQCTSINVLKEQIKALRTQVGVAGKQFEELRMLREDFKKFKEQKPEACLEGQHRNEQGECVPDEEPEAVTELKAKLTETLTRIDNLESKQKGLFKANAPALPETKEGDSEYTVDPRLIGRKRK